MDALKSFYAERDAHAQQFEKLQAAAEEQHASSSQQPLSMSLFTEDWNESQFWACFLPLDLTLTQTCLTRSQYSDETATHLAKQLLDGATPDMTVVVVSAPSVFVQLKNLVVGHMCAP